MLKISYVDCLGLFLAILAQFTFKLWRSPKLSKIYENP